MTMLTGARPLADPPAGEGGGAAAGTAGKTRPAARRRPSALAVTLFVLLAGLVLVPVAMVFFGAFQSKAPGLPGNEFSLRAILAVYGSPTYLVSLVATLVMAVVTAALAVGLGGLAAWALARTDVRLRRTLEVGIILPLFISPFIGALAWNLLGAPKSGIINVNLRWMLGTDATFIDIGTVPGVVFVMLLYFLPYAYLIISSSLKNMDPSLEEASYINGRGVVETAARVTFPIVRPSLTAAFFMIAVFGTGMFSIPQVLGIDLGFAPLALQVYRRMEAYPSDPPVAAALGTLIFWFTLLGIYFYRRSVRNSRRFVTVGGKGSRRRVVQLGWARWPVTIVIALYGFFAAVLPYFALILMSFTPYAMTDLRELTFSLSSFTTVVTSPDVLTSLWNTLWIALLAPTIAILIGLGAAYVVTRERGRLGGAIDYVSTFPMAVPGIVFATGIVWLYVRSPLYATVFLIVITLVASYMPQAMRFASTGLMQVDPSLEEAARMNGAGKLRSIFSVTMPIISPSLMSSWLLLFIFAAREVNETVIVAGPHSRPLSVLAWDYTDAGQITQAAVVGLLLTLVMVLGLVVARLVFRVRLDSEQL